MKLPKSEYLLLIEHVGGHIQIHSLGKHEHPSTLFIEEAVKRYLKHPRWYQARIVEVIFTLDMDKLRKKI